MWVLPYVRLTAVDGHCERKKSPRPARDAASPVSMVTKAKALIIGCSDGKQQKEKDGDATAFGPV